MSSRIRRLRTVMDAPPPADRTRFFTSMNPSVSASAALASSSESELLEASSSDAKSFSSAGTSPSSTLLALRYARSSSRFLATSALSASARSYLSTTLP